MLNIVYIVRATYVPMCLLDVYRCYLTSVLNNVSAVQVALLSLREIVRDHVTVASHVQVFHRPTTIAHGPKKKKNASTSPGSCPALFGFFFGFLSWHCLLLSDRKDGSMCVCACVLLIFILSI